jgi:hypothetical protein
LGIGCSARYQLASAKSQPLESSFTPVPSLPLFQHRRHRRSISLLLPLDFAAAL